MSRNKIYDNLIDELKTFFNDQCDFNLWYIKVPDAKIKAINLLQQMHDVYVAKDSDYSENDLPMGNLRESTELGIEPWKGVLLRIGDKKRRIGSFISKGDYQVKDEAVEDTLIDMANYSLLGASLFVETNDNPDFLKKWLLIARFCIMIKISYENDRKIWALTLWPYVLTQYKELASLASK